MSLTAAPPVLPRRAGLPWPLRAATERGKVDSGQALLAPGGWVVNTRGDSKPRRPPGRIPADGTPLDADGGPPWPLRRCAATVARPAGSAVPGGVVPGPGTPECNTQRPPCHPPRMRRVAPGDTRAPVETRGPGAGGRPPDCGASSVVWGIDGLPGLPGPARQATGERRTRAGPRPKPPDARRQPRSPHLGREYPRALFAAAASPSGSQGTPRSRRPGVIRWTPPGRAATVPSERRLTGWRGGDRISATAQAGR